MKHLEKETNRGLKWLSATFLILFSLLASAQMPKDGELFSLDPEAVTGRSFGTVTAIVSSPSDESLWIGTESEGILRIGRNGNRICYNVQTNHLLSNSISEMCFVSPSLLYILYSDGRLTSYSSTEGFSHLGNLDVAISHILPASDEGKLIAALNDGKICFVENKTKVSTLADLQEPVTVVTTGEGGKIYLVGSRSMTVQCLNNGAKETLTGPLPETPTCLFATKDGSLFAGSGQGLFCWKQNGWSRLSTADGLVSNRINAILAGDDGVIYLPTPKGVQALNVSNSNVSKTDVYFSGDSFVSAQKIASKNTVFYFGGPKGIAAITPTSPSVSLPWMQVDEELQSNEKKSIFNLWSIILMIALGLLGFLAGRLVSKGKKEEPETVNIPPRSVTPTVVNTPRPAPVSKPVAAPVSPRPTPAPTPTLTSPAAADINDSTKVETEPKVTVEVPAPSHDDVFGAIKKLNKGDAPEFSLKVWNMIEESYTDPEFSVADIASRLLLSRVHVNRKLQQELEVSPSSLLKARRMTAARELMLKGGMTIKDIAEQSGFSSAAFMSTSFKEYFGQSPSEVMRTS